MHIYIIIYLDRMILFFLIFLRIAKICQGGGLFVVYHLGLIGVILENWSRYASNGIRDTPIPFQFVWERINPIKN